MTWRTRLALHLPNEDTSFWALAAASPHAFAVAFHEDMVAKFPTQAERNISTEPVAAGRSEGVAWSLSNVVNGKGS
jgi:hypothetical protein